MSAYQLAQLNIGIIKGPMDGPVMADFAASLQRINAVADQAPGVARRWAGLCHLPSPQALRTAQIHCAEVLTWPGEW